MCPKCLSIQSVQVSKVSKCPKHSRYYTSIQNTSCNISLQDYKFQCPVFVSIIHYGDGQVTWIRMESGNVSRSITSGIMEMEKLHGLGQKLEMCPDPSHLELWKWKSYMD